MMTPLSVAGGYWTGSSAVVDLLAEHPQCTVVPYEFTLFTFGQFFQEVYQFLGQSELDTNLAFENKTRFDAFGKSDIYPVRAIIRKACRALEIYPAWAFSRRCGINQYLGVNYRKSVEELSLLLRSIVTENKPVERDEINRLISRVLELAEIGARGESATGESDNQRIGVFDQMIAPPYERYSRESLPTLRCINVDRGWRDQYISMRNAYRGMLSVNESLGVRPWDEDYQELRDLNPIDYFVCLRKTIDKYRFSQQSHPHILWIDFETLINDQVTSANRVFEFLDIDPEKWKSNIHFHPEISRRRTNKWLNQKWQSNQLDSELEEIADRLKY